MAKAWGNPNPAANLQKLAAEPGTKAYGADVARAAGGAPGGAGGCTTFPVRAPSEAAALVVTLDDVRRAYPTWRCSATVGGCVARAVLVPSWVVYAATAPGLLREIEASIGARRDGRHPVPAAHHAAGQGGSCRFPADRQDCLLGRGAVNVAAVQHPGGAR